MKKNNSKNSEKNKNMLTAGIMSKEELMQFCTKHHN